VPQLFGTPLSHFTRKIRILLAELGVDFQFVRTANVITDDPRGFADNPLMRVPTFVHGDDRLVESDHIARYIVAHWDPADRFGVRSDQVSELNRLAVINGVMANEVTVILAKRGGLTDLESITYFRKLGAAIDGGLAWLDREPWDGTLRYVDIALICLWQHLAHYQVTSLDAYERLAARVAQFAERPSVAATTPEQSLLLV
jgi:glutathione S-transferase